MAMIETWVKCELKKAVQVQYLQGNLFSLDNQGNLVGVEVFDEGEPASLSGTVSANVIRADGGTVAVSGTLSGNKCYVVLPQAAYQVPGVVTIVIKLTASSVVTTLAAVVTTVYRSSTETAVDPGTIISDINTLIAEIEAAVATIPADYSSLWTTLAPAYSTSSTYAVGQYVTYNGGLYRCTTAITSGESWTSGHWTAAKLGPDISDLKSALTFDEYLINGGQYTIKASDLESGKWGYSTKSEDSTRARTKLLLPVRAGMVISYSNTTFDIFIGVLSTQTSNSYVQNSGWVTTAEGKYNIVNDGWMTFIIRNHTNTSATVDPSEYNSTVKITTTMKQSDNSNSQVVGSLTKAVADNEGRFIFEYVEGTVSNITASIRFETGSIVTKDIIYFDNEFVRLSVATGYTATVMYKNQNDTNINRDLSAGDHYFYGGKNIPVRFVIQKTGITINENNALTIERISGEETYDIGCGIKGHETRFEKETNISGTILRYYNAENRYASIPIKLPKSGLRIGYNPKYHSTEYIYSDEPQATPLVINYKFPAFKVCVAKKADNGMVVQTTDENLEAVTNSGTSLQDSVYIPYVEDCYVIITINTENALSGKDYSDLLYVTSGEVDRGYCGVYNICPTGLSVASRTNNGLDIHGIERNYYVLSSSMYYCTVLRLREVKKIVCSPKYTLLAEIYKINNDRTISKYADTYGVWTSDSPDGQHTTSGISVIDFEQYDFDGFALVAIQAPVTYLKSTTSTGYSIKRWSTGLLGGYEDVMRSVCVDYYNGVNVSYVPGMPSILDENIHKLCNWKIPVYGNGRYVEQGFTSSYRFNTMYNVVPGMYNGTYIANSYLMNVTAKSLMTCVKNRNGRMRKMQRVEADQPGTDGVATLGNIGYGLTCTNFVSVIHGLMENYSPWAMCFQDNEKFDRMPFDYHDLSKLRPGDVLSKKIPELQISRTSDAHCMTVSSIVTINGVVRAINIIEGYAPFDRFSTYLDEEYYNVEGVTNWITDTYSFKNLENYKFASRIKPQYLKPIEETFDMYPASTDVGTVMCDRGTNSIYGIHTNYVELSFNDADVTTNLYLYKGGTPVATIPKSGAYTVNGLKLLNIASYLDGEGLYTVKTDQSNDVQETFYVKGDVEAMTYVDGIPELGDIDYPESLTPEQIERNWTKLTLHSSDINDLVWLEIRYGATFPEDPEDPEKDRRNPYIKAATFLKEQFIPDDTENPTEWTLTVPQFMQKTYTDFVPPSDQPDYPAEPNWSAIKGIYRVYKTQYGTYHATQSGRVSSEYYGID